MKAVISSTYDDKYLYFIPLVTFLWNKLGVDVICFMPSGNSRIERSGGFIQGAYPDGNKKMYLINDTVKKNNGSLSIRCFNAPEHKEATYAQCSRLYGACLDLPEDEILITGDCDMAVFWGEYLKQKWASFDIYGADLVPKGQVPICYISASAKDWRKVFGIDGKTYQECLDEQLGELEAEHFRGNFWSRDQEIAYNKLIFPKDLSLSVYQHFRAKPGTQFASKRVDRDNFYWRENLTPDLIDAHLWRNGYDDDNFKNIMELLTTMYPDENFDWMVSYTEAYKKLIV